MPRPVHHCTGQIVQSKLSPCYTLWNI